MSRAGITHTVVSSATREVVIGFDRPFTIIGERINPTGRKLLAEEMKAGDFSRVERDAVAQVEAGAHMLDVNAGIPLADEPAILARTIQLVQSLVDVPLSIDSSIVEALEAGLAVYQGKPLVNSVTGEEERLERVLPLIKRYGAAVVAISNDDTGISEDPDVRFEVARKIVQRAADYGIPREDVLVDPLVMPIGAMATAGQQVFRLVRRLREELGVNSTCGASNVSFGMPDRERINAAFLPMAIASGLTSAITNPLAAEVKAAIMAADVLMGNDQDAVALDPGAPGGGGAARPTARAIGPGPRRRRRRGRRAAERDRGRLERRATGRQQAANQPPGPRRRGRDARRRRRGQSAGLSRRAPMSSDSMSETAQVIFTPSGRRGRFEPGTTVLDAARTLGVDLDSVCGGRGLCGRCQVVPAEGSYPKHGIESSDGHLSAARRGRGRSTTGSAGLAPGRRLGCLAHIQGDVLVDVPPESQVHRQVVRKGVPVRDFVIDPVVTLHEVEVERPDLAKPGGDLARVLAALEREWGLTGLEADLDVVRGLQPALEAGGYRVTVAVHDRRVVTARLARACTIGRSASRSTSARRRSPGTWRISRTARSSPRTA